jgi:hypothetical protein
MDYPNDLIEHEIKIITTLLDNFEYFKYGLCKLAKKLAREEIIYGYFYDDIIEWLDYNTPPYKYPTNPNGIICYSWKVKTADPRWYWLQHKLIQAKLKILTENWIKDRQGNIIESAKGGPEFKNGTKLKQINMATKGKTLFKKLTTAQKIKFKENHRLCERNDTWKEYMNSNFKSFWFFIGEAFLWSKTKQGQEYWYEISKQNK